MKSIIEELKNDLGVKDSKHNPKHSHVKPQSEIVKSNWQNELHGFDDNGQLFEENMDVGFGEKHGQFGGESGHLFEENMDAVSEQDHLEFVTGDDQHDFTAKNDDDDVATDYKDDFVSEDQLVGTGDDFMENSNDLLYSDDEDYAVEGGGDFDGDVEI